MKSWGSRENTSLCESVMQSIQSKIFSGELKAGDWLPPERDLAEQLGISRGSLHQAILALSHQGLVSIVPRKGTVICDYRRNPTPQSLAVVMNYGSVNLDKDLFSDMMSFRIWLECECARLACSQISESILLEMRSIAALILRPDADLVELIYRFHYLLTVASGNSIFSMIFRGFEAAVKGLTRQSYQEMGTDIQVTAQRMRLLIQCLREGKESEAQETVQLLLSPGIEQLRTKYKN